VSKETDKNTVTCKCCGSEISFSATSQAEREREAEEKLKYFDERLAVLQRRVEEHALRTKQKEAEKARDDVPLCWNCASQITKQGAHPGVRVMSGCMESKRIRCWRDAEEFCPWLNEDKLPRIEIGEIRELPPMVEMEVDMDDDLFDKLYQRGLKELSPRTVVGVYMQEAFTEMVEKLRKEDEDEDDGRDD
jgi:hypothetical protein